MPARAKYNKRRIDVRLDAETEAALQYLMDVTGLTESKVIRKVILDAAKANRKPSKP